MIYEAFIHFTASSNNVMAEITQINTPSFYPIA